MSLNLWWLDSLTRILLTVGGEGGEVGRRKSRALKKLLETWRKDLLE